MIMNRQTLTLEEEKKIEKDREQTKKNNYSSFAIMMTMY